MLKQYNEIFERLDQISIEFANGCISTPDATDTVMKELAGIYGSLNNKATEFEAIKVLAFKKFYETKKAELEMTTGKVSITQIEREFANDIAEMEHDLITLRGKLVSCDKLISVCQSSLKSLERERRFS